MVGSSVIIKHLNKDFGDFHALQDVSLSIKNGEFFSILGPSGCGKTTLLRLIAGFDFPDSGSIYLEDKDIVNTKPEQRNCNTVFQNYALFPHLNIFENIAFPLRIKKKMSEEEIEEKVKKYLSLVQLEGQEYKKISQISGGQKQRVAIARALINEPKVLLLDEPLSALDQKLRYSLLIDLDNIHDKVGITFIYITHDQGEALSVSDRIAVMDKGKVLQVGAPFEIYERPATEFVASFIGETNIYSGIVQSSTPMDCGDAMIKLKLDNFDMPIYVTDYKSNEIGERELYTIRPEKIHISLQKPSSTKYSNILSGVVEEPIYAGFQSKLYVRLENGELLKVYKQNIKFLDDGPEINFEDRVYLSWRAGDGYLIKDTENEK